MPHVCNIPVPVKQLPRQRLTIFVETWQPRASACQLADPPCIHHKCWHFGVLLGLNEKIPPLAYDVEVRHVDDDESIHAGHSKARSLASRMSRSPESGVSSTYISLIDWTDFPASVLNFT